AVLDALIYIREYLDESLVVRCACRSAICGSCAMWINGHANLACKSRLDKFAVDGKVTVEAAPSMPVVRDLVWDMSAFWQKHRAVIPWLEHREPVPEREYAVPNPTMENLIQEVSCISCGCCLMDCESFAVNPDFLGPHALAKAYRYADDPRDAIASERLYRYSQPGGIWDCTHCYECVTQCPKGVAPLDQILKLRRMAVQAGYSDNNGTRHADAFAESVHHAGRLDELMLVPKSHGLFNVGANLKELPGAWNLLRAGKLFSMLHGAIPGIARIREIFAKVGGRFGGKHDAGAIDAFDQPYHRL
ncbi:MAG: 4Fe-4S dicluster domain-containing protein, partial [bacterium]|nr:4Fe-4S dicluster domain-containing protein [bacterium]